MSENPELTEADSVVEQDGHEGTSGPPSRLCRVSAMTGREESSHWAASITPHWFREVSGAVTATLLPKKHSLSLFSLHLLHDYV